MFWNTDIDFAEVPQVDILAIGAQPGDVELSCGATLFKMATAGYKTAILDLTRGEMTGAGLPEERVAESKKAAEALQALWRGTLAMPDARLENTVGARMTLAGTIRRLRPKTVILPPLGSRWPDHHYTAELGWEACALSSISAVDDYSAAHRADRVLFTAEHDPQFVVDVSACFGAVEAALACYKTRFASVDEALRQRRAVLAYLGIRIGAGLAEGFSSREIFNVPDIVNMGLRAVSIDPHEP